MHAKKAAKLHRDVAGFLDQIRTAAVRMEGRLKVAIQVDARGPAEKDALGRLLGFPTGLLASVDDLGAGLGAAIDRLTDRPEAAK